MPNQRAAHRQRQHPSGISKHIRHNATTIPAIRKREKKFTNRLTPNALPTLQSISRLHFRTSQRPHVAKITEQEEKPMATRRHYIDHDDTKPRKKNEHYEVKEYNVKENTHSRYWRESGKPARYQDLNHLYNRSRIKINDNWWTVIGTVIGVAILFLLKSCGITK